MTPIGFSCIGGYLGAGKTTLINQLLTNPKSRRYAVLVNDFGEINIDAALIASHDGDTIALENGCVCCSLAQGFAAALDTVRERTPAIDHVVVEVSGVGDPWKSAQWGHSPGFELRAVVCVAGLDQIVTLLADRYVGDTVRSQLGGADLVVATKSAVAGENAAAAFAAIAEVTNAPVFGAPFDLEVLVDPGFDTAGHSDDTAAGRADHATHEVMIVDARHRSPSQVQGWLASAPPEVVRAKGIVGDTLLQLVGKRLEVTPAGDLAMRLRGDLVVFVRPTADRSHVEQWLATLA